MWDHLCSIFDTSGFLPRGSCGPWDDWHRFLYKWSHLGIFIEYLVMPLTALYIALVIRRTNLWRRQKEAEIKAFKAVVVHLRKLNAKIDVILSRTPRKDS